MDIIDIVLARNSTFSAETAKLVQQANAAMAKANEVAGMVDEAQEALDAANAAATAAETIEQNLEQLQNDITSAAEDLIAEQAVTDVNVSDESTSNAQIKHINVEKNNITTTYDLYNYNQTGSSTSGTMTQKAITDELTRLENKINTSGGVSNLGTNNAGKMVSVGTDGNITASSVTEEQLINIINGGYTPPPAPSDDTTILGFEANYIARTFTRTEGAVHLNAGTDFDSFKMYGGRKRCNVTDDGTITAFYGDVNYREDGSNGQVMVYQPKFYYMRVPYSTDALSIGQVVREDSFLISEEAKTGFKLHPLFINETGEQLEYVLLSAYESSYYDDSTSTYVTDDNSNINFNNDKLTSIANVKPISGANKNLTLENCERLATNRGENWHITNMAAESANQMLFMIEYATLNSQTHFNRGICDLTNVTNANFSCNTGSTSSLGNSSGMASESINVVNGTAHTYNAEGQCAISYRGIENPWGNIWRYIGGALIYGDGSQNGGVPYICDNFNYQYVNNAENYHSVGFCLPNTSSWISGLGYGNSAYDWVLLPAECSGANAVNPIGDTIWVSENLSEPHVISIGGTGAHGDNDGLFYYACDRTPNGYGRVYSARLMFIPHTTDSNYQSNIALWQNTMGA